MATYSIREIYAAARAAGFTPDQATTWTAIALAESGGKTSALNNNGEHSMGLWQINVASNVRSNHWGNLNDPLVNARAAYEVSRHGRDMRPWTTTHASNRGTAHDYRTYLAKVEGQTGAHGDWRGVSGYGAPMPSALSDGGTPSGQAPASELAAGNVVPDDAATQQAGLTGQGSQVDTDHDGLTDLYEKSVGTNPALADADHDGLSDGFEVAQSHSNPGLADTDGDGLPDATEVALGTDPTSADTDHDGLIDQAEIRFGTNPLVANAGDGLPTPVAPATDQSTTGVPRTPLPPSGSAATMLGTSSGDSRVTLGQTQPSDAAAPPAAAAAAAAPQRQTTTDRFVQAAVEQRGDRYIYGAETKLSDPNPRAIDCSELTQWAARQAGVTIPDGAEWQYLDLKQKQSLISVDEALHTKGALLFSFSFEPTASGPRPSHAHVAISLGDGRTIEARGRAYGVDEFSAKNRFNYAGVIPGVSGTDLAPAEPSHPADVVATHTEYDQIDNGVPPDRTLDTDHDGLTDAFERLAGTSVTKADTDADGLTDAYEAMVSHTDPLSADTDHDGVSDPLEISRGTDPGHLAGVAGVSGTGQYAENIRTAVIDSDHDGLSDRYEKLAHLNPQLMDTDGDGLSDPLEVALGTNPTMMDSDGDGLTDKLELELGRDPLRIGTGVGGTGLGDGLGADDGTGPGPGHDPTAATAAEPHPPPLAEHL